MILLVRDRADVVLFFPNQGQMSDEELGDEDQINPDHLSEAQLIAPTEIQIER